MLQIGSRIRTEEWLWRDAGALSILPGQRAVLVLLPTAVAEPLRAGVERFRSHQEEFTKQAATLLISPARPAATPLPAVVILDENEIVRQVYDGERYPALPNPAAVVRALRKLNDAPRPLPVDATDWQRGPRGAKVAVIEYSDYECKHCQVLHEALQSLPDEISASALRVHRHLPLRATHPLAQLAAEAAEAAGAQGRFWAMHDRLFAAHGELEEPALVRYAEELNLDVPRFQDELSARKHEKAVSEDLRRAVVGGIKLPPSLFVNGVLYEGDRSPAGLETFLADLLR